MSSDNPLARKRDTRENTTQQPENEERVRSITEILYRAKRNDNSSGNAKSPLDQYPTFDDPKRFEQAFAKDRKRLPVSKEPNDQYPITNGISKRIKELLQHREYNPDNTPEDTRKKAHFLVLSYLPDKQSEALAEEIKIQRQSEISNKSQKRAYPQTSEYETDSHSNSNSDSDYQEGPSHHNPKSEISNKSQKRTYPQTSEYETDYRSSSDNDSNYASDPPSTSIKKKGKMRTTAEQLIHTTNQSDQSSSDYTIPKEYLNTLVDKVIECNSTSTKLETHEFLRSINIINPQTKRLITANEDKNTWFNYLASKNLDEDSYRKIYTKLHGMQKSAVEKNRARRRRGNMTEEKRERERAKKRRGNMTEEQIAKERAKERRENMTEEQIAKERARKRRENMTEEQISRKRERAKKRRENMTEE